MLLEARLCFGQRLELSPLDALAELLGLLRGVAWSRKKAQYVGMHPHIVGYPSISGCKAIYVGAPMGRVLGFWT